MRAVRSLVLICLLVALLPGCVAPGSSIGHVSIRGSLVSSTGEPLPNREVQFIIPAEYGLGGLDLVLNKPEDFGHQRRSFSVTTNSNGEFSHDLGEQIYHVSVWLLPPLGSLPRHPPAPFFYVRVPSFPGEYYAVQTHDGQFKALTVDGAELPLAQSHLSGLTASSEVGSTNGKRWTVGVMNLRFALPQLRAVDRNSPRRMR